MSQAEKLAVVIEVLLDTAQAAQRLNVDEGTLKNWRSQGRGPDYVVVGGGGGRLVRYTPRALDEHIEAGTRHAARAAGHAARKSLLIRLDGLSAQKQGAGCLRHPVRGES